jgi:shikimate 5-dehydrogenase
VSLAKSCDIGFAVKAPVRNSLMHYVQELQLETNILSVNCVYQTKVTLFVDLDIV